MRHPDRAVAGVTLAALALVVVSAVPADAIASEARPGAPAWLDAADETAALHAVHIGLTEIPDGATFVWRRAHGRLSGAVRPVSSFKSADGGVCRHLVLTLRSGTYERTVEGIACRQPDGRWALEG